MLIELLNKFHIEFLIIIIELIGLGMKMIQNLINIFIFFYYIMVVHKVKGYGNKYFEFMSKFNVLGLASNHNLQATKSIH